MIPSLSYYCTFIFKVYIKVYLKFIYENIEVFKNDKIIIPKFLLP
jgi:hypothetical protein